MHTWHPILNVILCVIGSELLPWDVLLRGRLFTCVVEVQLFIFELTICTNYVRISLHMYTVETLYYGYFGTLILVLITEVSSVQRSFNTLQYYTGTQNGVLIREVSAIQRFIIWRFHCISVLYDLIHAHTSTIYY